jgi:hypothetical protein
MISWMLLFEHSLRYGGILSLILTGLVLVTLIFFPRMWVSRAPADIQQALGGLSPREMRLARVFQAITLMSVVGILGYSVVQLSAVSNGALGFFAIAASLFLIMQVWNVVDLLLIDWLLIVKLRPAFMMFPGIEQLPGFGDYGFHFRGFLKGIILSLVVGIVIAAFATVGTFLI